MWQGLCAGVYLKFQNFPFQEEKRLKVPCFNILFHNMVSQTLSLLYYTDPMFSQESCMNIALYCGHGAGETRKLVTEVTVLLQL